MNRTLERTTMIIIALLLSIGFTGQHHSHAEVPLQIKVNVVSSIQSDIYREKYIEPTETELLTQLYIERELDALDYVKVVDTMNMFKLTIFVTEHATPLFDGDKFTMITLFYVLTLQQTDGNCQCYVVSGLTRRSRQDLRQECKAFVAGLAHKVLEKYKP